MSSSKLVLVAGGSGISSRNIKYGQLCGHQSGVTKSVMLLRAGGVANNQIERVKFVVADLAKDDGWVEACQGCSYVLHVATPFPAGAPKNEDDLIMPAREGTLRVLKAAKRAGTAQRVVLTWELGPIFSGYPSQEEPFTENDWTNLDSPEVSAYYKSKTLAERAAWDWCAEEGGSLELAVINRGLIIGLILGEEYGVSMELLVRLLNGQLPGLPRLEFGIVDVRDVADLHIKAMVHSNAKGERFIAVTNGPSLTLYEIAQS